MLCQGDRLYNLLLPSIRLPPRQCLPALPSGRGWNACHMQLAKLTFLGWLQQIPGSDDYRFNFWGYSTINFFAPMARYSQVRCR